MKTKNRARGLYGLLITEIGAGRSLVVTYLNLLIAVGPAIAGPVVRPTEQRQDVARDQGYPRAPIQSPSRQ